MRGFSLIELLITVTLLVILYLLLLSPSAKSFQMGKIAECANNLRNIQIALKTFSTDSGGRLPYLTNAPNAEVPLSLLIPRYTTGTEFFICPGSGDAALPGAQPFAGRRISYAYYMGRTLGDGPDQPLLTDRQVNTNPKQAGEPLFSSDGKKPGNNHNKYGGNVMFSDGGVKWSPAQCAFTLTNAAGVILLNPKP